MRPNKIPLSSKWAAAQSEILFKSYNWYIIYYFYFFLDKNRHAVFKKIVYVCLRATTIFTV